MQNSASLPNIAPQLDVVCAPGTSAKDYHKCLHFLQTQQPDFAPESFQEALGLVCAANHLGYQECVDACMAFVAAIPLSDEEETAITSVLTSTGMKASAELAARLEHMNSAIRIFKEALASCAERTGSTNGADDALTHMVRLACSASGDVAPMVRSALTEAWIQVTDEIIAGHTHKINTWAALASSLMQEFFSGEEHHLTRAFLEKYEEFCGAVLLKARSLMRVNDGGYFAENLTGVLIRVIECGGKRPVLLSNKQRASLVQAMAPLVKDLQDDLLNWKFCELVTTLPLRDQVLLNLLNDDWEKPYLSEAVQWWRRKVKQRMAGEGSQVLQASS